MNVVRLRLSGCGCCRAVIRSGFLIVTWTLAIILTKTLSLLQHVIRLKIESLNSCIYSFNFISQHARAAFLHAAHQNAPAKEKETRARQLGSQEVFCHCVSVCVRANHLSPTPSLDARIADVQMGLTAHSMSALSI